MGKEMIHQQGDDYQRRSDEEQDLPLLVEQSVTDGNTQRQSRFPSQEIGALRRSSLTMAAQLDEEQQEA